MITRFLPLWFVYVFMGNFVEKKKFKIYWSVLPQRNPLQQAVAKKKKKCLKTFSNYFLICKLIYYFN